MVIYEIVNVVNNKRYVGLTTRTLDARWAEHKRKLQLNQHNNSKLQNAWNKYGFSNFVCKVLGTANTLAELSAKEEYYVNSNIDGYNLRSGGYKGWSHAEETKRKLSNAKTGKPNGQRGLKKSKHTSLFCEIKSKRQRPVGYVPIVDPSGAVHTIKNLREFCRSQNLVFSGLRTLFDSHAPCYQYLGWRIATDDTIGVAFSDESYTKNLNISKGRRPGGFPVLMSPDGNLVDIEPTLTEFCRRNKLSAGCVSQLINGKKTSYMQWTVYTNMET